MSGAAARRKEPTRGLSTIEEALAAIKIFTEGAPPGFVHRYDAFLPALAGNQKETRVAPRRSQRQRHELRYPETGCIQQFEHAAEAAAFLPWPKARGLDQCSDLGFSQQFGQRPTEPRRIELRRRVILPHAFDQKKLVELPHRRDASGEGPGRRPSDRVARDVRMQARGFCRLERDPALAEELRKIR